MPEKKRKIIDVFPKPRDSSSAWSSSQTYLFHKGQGSWRGDGEGEGHHQSQQQLQLQLQLRLQDLHHHQRHHCHHCQRVIWSLSPAPPITLVYGAITEPETIKVSHLLMSNTFADFEQICWCWTHLSISDTNWKLSCRLEKCKRSLIRCLKLCSPSLPLVLQSSWHEIPEFGCFETDSSCCQLFSTSGFMSASQSWSQAREAVFGCYWLAGAGVGGWMGGKSFPWDHCSLLQPGLENY